MGGDRLSRGASLSDSEAQMQLRRALRRNDLETFKNIVNNVDVKKLDYEYQDPDYKTILELAISDPGKEEFVKVLINNKVNVNHLNSTRVAAAIHFAVENCNPIGLKALLEDSSVDVDIKSKGNTALLLAIKKIKEVQDKGQDYTPYVNMIELLLNAGCNPNSPDLKGITPVYLAAKLKLEQVVMHILDNAKIPVDIDTYKDRQGKTARYILGEVYPHLLERFDSFGEVIETIDNDKLFSYLSKHEEENFIRDFSELVRNNEQETALSANNGMNTMLQLATDKGFERVVYTLLASGANPNATCAGNTNRPVAIACQNGYFKILKKFYEHEANAGSILYDDDGKESLIQTTIKGMRLNSKNPKSDFNSCLGLLLKHPKLNVNHLDIKHNTALHYAARNGDHDTVLKLLKNGACIGLRNKFNEPPLADINAKTLETYLDDCISTNGERPSDDDFQIHMTYRFLVYPNNSLEQKLDAEPLMDNANNNAQECDAILAPETDALLYMTRNEDLRKLLKHPVITSFLYLKWQRISCLFFANITFYALFWLSLILYIILGYGVEKKQSDSIEILNVVTHVGTIIGLLLLIFRELFQLLVSPTRYLRSIENWMELALIIVTAWIIFSDSAPESTKQQLSAIAILLSSAELVLLIGQFPTLSTNIVMLKTVSWNFFKFLLWYCILIIAFALSFYTLFRKEADEDQTPPDPNKAGNEGEDEEDFFEDPGRSLFKTIVMLTGEFDAGSIKFSTFPVTSHIIFLVFVFMIPIVLFNLLNGLAVSDTQEIRADAELVGHISRIKLISYFESVLIGNASHNTRPTKAWFLSSYLENLHLITPKTLCIKLFVKQITLFPHFLPNYRIIVKPNEDNIIKIPQGKSSVEFGEFGDDFKDVESAGCCFARCQNYRLDKKIVKNAKLVLSKKTNLTELDEIKNKLLESNAKLENLENVLTKVLHALKSR